MASVLVPLLYVFIVFGGLWVFSYYYKRHTLQKVVDPYFPRHHERDVYVSLLQKTDPPTPDALLKAALLRRAVTDVSRIMRLREDKPALQNLLQKGSIGDDLWNSLLAAERELEAEILETAAEANTFVDGWGTIIFQTATELLNTEKMRHVVENIQNIRAEKEQRYGIKSVPLRVPASAAPVRAGAIPGPTVFSPGTPVPAPAPAPAPASAPAPVSSVPPTPATPATPVTPLTASLALPTSPGSESVASSDGEGSTSPRTPKSAKKTKKRK